MRLPRLGAAAAIGHGGFVTLSPFFSCFSVKVPLFFAHQIEEENTQPTLLQTQQTQNSTLKVSSPLLFSLLICFWITGNANAVVVSLAIWVRVDCCFLVCHSEVTAIFSWADKAPRFKPSTHHNIFCTYCPWIRPNSCYSIMACFVPSNHCRFVHSTPFFCLRFWFPGFGWFHYWFHVSISVLIWFFSGLVMLVSSARLLSWFYREEYVIYVRLIFFFSNVF